MGLVVSMNDAAPTGGRPASRVVLNPVARLVLAADLGASHARVAVTDLNAGVLCHEEVLLDIGEGPEAVLGWMIATGNRLLADIGRGMDDLIGVGIGLPGPVEHDTGVPTRPPIMPGWDGFDVPAWVQQSLHAASSIPVLVDNDVNIMALGERTAAWPDIDNLAFVKVATGIGAGIISSGTLQRGAQGIAGDIGHIPIPRASGISCRCGNLGCLEAVASGPAIAHSLSSAGLKASTGQDVVQLVKQGNIDAIQAIRQAGRDIGEVLTVYVNVLNPSVIVIGGSMSRAGEHLIAGVREIVYSRSMPLATEHLRIVQSRAGQDAAVIGASILAIDHVLSADNVAV
jgi:predicted NBD/HSP70 family sugar kinase